MDRLHIGDLAILKKDTQVRVHAIKTETRPGFQYEIAGRTLGYLLEVGRLPEGSLTLVPEEDGIDREGDDSPEEEA